MEIFTYVLVGILIGLAVLYHAFVFRIWHILVNAVIDFFQSLFRKRH